jgi:hypothetical protein
MISSVANSLRNFSLSQNFGRCEEKTRSFSSLKILSVHLLNKQKIFVHISREKSEFCILACHIRGKEKKN